MNKVWKLIEKMNTSKGVTEIMINGPQTVFIESSGEMIHIDEKLPKSDLNAFVQEVVTYNRSELSVERPILDGTLPNGSRINIITGPYVKTGIAISIRQYLQTIKSFDTSPGIFGLNQNWITFFKKAVSARLNILVSGGTSVGKTTFLNLLLKEISEEERIVTIEDTFELSSDLPNWVALEAAVRNAKEKLTIRDLVKNSLRMRPDRIILGEARGAEVFDLLQAMNTGHEGSMSSIHANSFRDAFSRIENLFMTAGYDIPIKAIRKQIAQGVDFVIQLGRDREGNRQVSEIAEITGMEGENILAHTLAENVDGKLLPTGVSSTNMTKLIKHGLSSTFFNDLN